MSEYGEFNVNLTGERSELLFDRLRATQEEACQDAPGWFIHSLDNRVSTVLGPVLTTLESRLNGKLDREEADATVTLLKKLHEELRLIRLAKEESDATIKRRVDEAHGDLEKQAGTMRDEIRVLLLEKKASEDQLKARDDQLKARGDQVEARDEKLKSRDDTITALKEQVTVLQRTVVARDDKITALEKHVTSLLRTVEAHDDQVKVLNEQVTVLRGTVDARDDQIKARDKTMGAMRDKIQALRSEAEGSVDQIKDLEVRVKAGDEKVADYDKQLDSLQRAAQVNKDENRRLRESRDALQAELQILRSDFQENLRQDVTSIVQRELLSAQQQAQEQGKRRGITTTDQPSKKLKGQPSDPNDSFENQIVIQDIIDNPLSKAFVEVRGEGHMAFCKASTSTRIQRADAKRIYVCQSCPECRKDSTQAFAVGWVPKAEEKVSPGFADVNEIPATPYAVDRLFEHWSYMEGAGKVVVFPSWAK